MKIFERFIMFILNLDTNLFYIFFCSYFEEVKDLSWTSNLSRKAYLHNQFTSLLIQNFVCFELTTFSAGSKAIHNVWDYIEIQHLTNVSLTKNLKCIDVVWIPYCYLLSIHKVPVKMIIMVWPQPDLTNKLKWWDFQN